MSLSWQTVLAIGIGGFLGSIARAYAVHFTNKHVPIEFPLGILLVNLIGSFVIGILFAYFSHYTVSINLAGHPGISVPAGFVNGLPVGIQMIGKYFDEGTLFKVSDKFEKIRGKIIYPNL